MKIKRTVSLIMCLILAAACHFPQAPVLAATAEKVNSETASAEIENEKFALYVEENGEASFYVKETGKWWHSNPTDSELNAAVSGIVKMQMTSQLIVTYLADGSNEKQATSRASATNSGGVSVLASGNGIKVCYDFKDEEFTVPLLYTLSDEGLKAEILNAEIEENGANLISKIVLLPYWGAASERDEGYFLVPDGCGALINFNNGKSTSGYQQLIYNTDEQMNETTGITVNEKAYMPLFGIKNNNQAMLSVIDGGSTACKLYASVSSGNNPYNYIYPEFTYRKTSVVQMLSKTWYPLDVTFVSKKRVDCENFSVVYIPVTGENADYGGMANTYREYLKKNGRFDSKPEKNYVPLYLDIYGSALVSDTFLGFPVKVNKSLTDFNEVKQLVDGLKESGITDISIRYKGISKAGLYNKNVPTGFNVSGKIGGKKGFNSLVSYLAEQSVGFYPDEDFVYMRKSESSVFKPNNVVRDVRQKNAVFYEYDISTGRQLSTGTLKYALKPNNTSKSIDKFLKSYLKTEARSLSLSTLGNTMLSDYGSEICFSSQTQEIFRGIFERLSDKGISVMLEAPYIYATEYADCIISAPGESSNYDIEDKTVPFYQMVLHGLVSYSTPSLNSAADNKTAVLKALETGSSLMYSLSATEYSEIIDDGYDDLSCIYAEDWLEAATKYGKEVYNALKNVADSEIIAHYEAAENVFATEYENGTVIYVNYSDTPYTIGNITVGAVDYYVSGGASN